MAYDSSRNYAQEIQDLIKKGGDPAKVNQLLNERLEKQQSMDTGYSTYDDTYRQAMDYMAGQGYTSKASANVDYAEIANQILQDQGNRGVEEMTDRSWADLGTVLDAREKKLATGQYDDWAKSTISEGGMAYNGEDSVHQMLKDYAAYTQAEQEYYRQLAENVLNGMGIGQSVGYSRDYGTGYSGGYYPGDVSGAPVAGVGGISGGSAGGGVSAPMPERVTTQGVSVPVYSEEDWAKKQQREAARDSVAVTNAATKAPVMGENNSYSQATTERAYDEAIQMLMEAGDKEAAAALQQSRNEFEVSGIADPLIPGVNPTNTITVGGGTGTALAEPMTEPTGGNTPIVTTPQVSQPSGGQGYLPTYTVPVSTPNSVAGQITDAEIDALLAEMGLSPTPVFSYAGTEFDNATLGSQTGDVARPVATGGGYSGGGVTVTPTAGVPVVQNQIDVDAAYQAAMDAARASGDYGSVNQIANAWNQYRAETGQLNPQDVPQQYRVYSNQAGDQSMMVTPNQMENFVDKGLIEVKTKPDGSYMYILRDRFTR